MLWYPEFLGRLTSSLEGSSFHASIFNLLLKLLSGRLGNLRVGLVVLGGPLGTVRHAEHPLEGTMVVADVTGSAERITHLHISLGLFIEGIFELLLEVSRRPSTRCNLVQGDRSRHVELLANAWFDHDTATGTIFRAVHLHVFGADFDVPCKVHLSQIDAVGTLGHVELDRAMLVPNSKGRQLAHLPLGHSRHFFHRRESAIALFRGLGQEISRDRGVFKD